MQNAYRRNKKVEKKNTAVYDPLIMKGEIPEKTVSYPLRLPAELDKALQKAAKKSGMTKAGLTKLCLEAGVHLIESCDYSIATAIVKCGLAAHTTPKEDIHSLPSPRGKTAAAAS